MIVTYKILFSSQNVRFFYTLRSGEVLIKFMKSSDFNQ